ncbi:MAG: DUF3293 domain-containing protein [Alteromonadaceae bacterium]|nr:DUF3293 domain-containing protein [Alteromonadaceae bacterium]
MKKKQIAQVFALWEKYKAVKFRIGTSFPDFQAFAIVTAYNPKSILYSEKTNQLRQQKLCRYLEKSQLKYRRVVAGNTDFTYFEPSLAIETNIAQASNLAKLYGQNAIYFVIDENLFLLPILVKYVEKENLGKFADFICE